MTLSGNRKCKQRGGKKEKKKKHSHRLLLSPRCQLSLWLYFSAVILTESLNTFQTSRRCLVSRSLKKLEKQPWVNVTFQKDCPQDCQATQLLEIFEGFQENLTLTHFPTFLHFAPEGRSAPKRQNSLFPTEWTQKVIMLKWRYCFFYSGRGFCGINHSTPIPKKGWETV